MRSRIRTGRSTSVLSHVAATLLVMLVAACSGGDAGPQEKPPVLVVLPGAGTATEMSLTGEIRAREESPLSFRIGGNLLERRVDVGDHVSEGDVLATLDPDDQQAQATAARAKLAALEADLRRTRADQARYAQLAKDQLVSRSNMDAQNAAAEAAQGQVDAARAELRMASNQAAYSKLVAPADGVIASRQAEAGQVVAAGQPVFTLAADGAREIVFAVAENAKDEVQPGKAVQVEVWSQPGKQWPGTVREVSPSADPASRTFAARATVDAPEGALQLGQSARVLIPTNTEGGAKFSIPLTALQRHGDGVAVFVVDRASSTLKFQPIAIGPYGNESVPVLDGLAKDDWVVAAGGHLLREGQEVAPVDRDNRPLGN
ncbi:efflux RND transporter periplasmic adaptor subunit [Novilysobacter antarcticus]|uniref:efflux RND transporter periplasmic adaptor subunit n=1 Tax=Novilysobacter antarcticus TaxID=2862543 RepID=UPI001C99691B|nr:efflux RND transporter periplasmic adaptor subunit [Lysobacter antarcticus]